MNLNDLAVAISKKEGKKVQVNIAQIKEIIRCLIDVFKEEGVPVKKKKTKAKKK